MPDPMLFLKAAAIAGAIAAVLMLLGGLPWKSPRQSLVGVAGVVGVAIGFYVGCWWLGASLRWPSKPDPNSMIELPLISVDQDRLLLIVVPAVALVEIVASFLGRFRAIAWAPRLIIAGLTARVILHNGKYIKDFDGPGSAVWNSTQMYEILAGLGLALAAEWAALVLLARRPGGRSVPLAVGLACAAGGMTMMLSGNLTDGQMGIPLSAAVIGATIATVAFGKSDVTGVVGLGIVTLFGLLVAGLFFSDLTVTNAALVFASPLLCWVPELLPVARRLKPGYRGTIRVALCMAPIVIALALAVQEFKKASSETSASSDEPTAADYENFGK
jgi:hypothetical protein